MSDKTVYVYLMEDLKFGDVKIGISYNPTARKKELEKRLGTKIALRYIAPFENQKVAANTEKSMHERYAELATGGEWFEIAIEAVLSDFPILWGAVDLDTETAPIKGERREQEKQQKWRLKSDDYGPFGISQVVEYFARLNMLNLFCRYMTYSVSLIQFSEWPDDIKQAKPLIDHICQDKLWEAVPERSGTGEG